MGLGFMTDLFLKSIYLWYEVSSCFKIVHFYHVRNYNRWIPTKNYLILMIIFLSEYSRNIFDGIYNIITYVFKTIYNA